MLLPYLGGLAFLEESQSYFMYVLRDDVVGNVQTRVMSTIQLKWSL